MQDYFERYEKKYCLTVQQQTALLDRLQPYLLPDKYGKYTICNIYYDTDDWRLVRASLAKPIYKEKLRVRSYGVPREDSLVFVELKKKYGGVVYKRRITTEVYMLEPLLCGLNTGETFGQIGREILWFQKRYRAKPKVFIGYDRTAYVGRDDFSLRVTFDANIRWRDTALDLCLADYGEALLPKEQILMEIKLSGACPLWLSHQLSEVGAFPVSFSKYGVCYHSLLSRQNHTISIAHLAC